MEELTLPAAIVRAFAATRPVVDGKVTPLEIKGAQLIRGAWVVWYDGPQYGPAGAVAFNAENLPDWYVAREGWTSEGKYMLFRERKNHEQR